MKEFKTFNLTEESVNLDRFDVLVRAGLANKAQIQRLHSILEKLHSKEDATLSRPDRMIMTNLFNKMLELITNDKMIFQKARQSVREESEFIEEETSELKKLPFILILKRKAIRLFPNGIKVATYYSDKLKRTFTLPASDLNMSSVTEEIDLFLETKEAPVEKEGKGTISSLNNIVNGKQHGVIKFKDGSSLKVDVFTAKAVLQLYSAASPENKTKLDNMANKDKMSFVKIADFAFGKRKK